MRLALIADVHSNLEALHACVRDARAHGVDALAFLGDLVGYGADPGPVLDAIREEAERGAFVVRGNHDEAAVRGPSEYMDPAAAAAIAWTRARLGPDHLAYLAALPLTIRRDDLLLVHASAAAPERWSYVTDPVGAATALDAAAAAGAGAVFCGHVHEQVLWYTGASGRPLPFKPVPGVAIPIARTRRWLAIVGSAGQPRDGRPSACWALADLGRRTLTFQRVAYDWPTAAAKIRAAGLPPGLADRLQRGE
jgi:diadenosine tetraphosphatase ApaH/serine/threonine PP2A family protein phosphatase